jgi:hypothetical protein
MTTEEKKAHKAKLAREWRQRTGKAQWKPYSEYTAEEKIVLSEQKKKWYQENKARLVEKARIRRANPTDEDKKINRDRMKIWRDNLTPEEKKAISVKHNEARRKKRLQSREEDGNDVSNNTTVKTQRS